MTYGDDPFGDDRHSEPTIDTLMLDELTADRLLEQPESSAPPGYAKVAVLLSLVSGPALHEELGGQELAVAAFLSARPALPRPRRRPPRAGRLAASGLAGVILLSGGVAAAATGSLPGPAQDAIAKALDHVGVDVPMSNEQSVSVTSHGRAGSAPTGGSSDTKTTGIDNGKGNGGTNQGGNGNHTGVSQPPGQANDHTKPTDATPPSTGVDNGKGNGGTNPGGSGSHTGVTIPHVAPTQPPQAKNTNIKP
jgi:hypothetical protein